MSELERELYEALKEATMALEIVAQRMHMGAPKLIAHLKAVLTKAREERT